MMYATFSFPIGARCSEKRDSDRFEAAKEAAKGFVTTSPITEGPRSLRAVRQGSGVVKAGDLVSDDQTVEVVNPGHVICTLGPEGDLEKHQN